MARPKYERTQPGNPHNLTVNQHVFPAASIARFCGPNGGVELYAKARASVRRATPRDKIFIAKRVWDHRSETGYMAGIERRFQELADRIISGEVTHLDPGHCEIAHRFYALWSLRNEHAQAEPSDVEIKGIVSVDQPRSKDDYERMEQMGFLVTEYPHTIKSRFNIGLSIQRDIDGLYEIGRHHNWGIARSSNGEFAAPDTPFAAMIPITPTIMLLGDNPDGDVAFVNLLKLNRMVAAQSQHYYFGRQLENCPGAEPGQTL